MPRKQRGNSSEDRGQTPRQSSTAALRPAAGGAASASGTALRTQTQKAKGQAFFRLTKLSSLEPSNNPGISIDLKEICQ